MDRREGYVVVRDFAGRRNARASSPFAIFADANRHAMVRAVELGRPVRILAADGQHIVTYARGPEGRAMVVEVA